MDSTRIKNIGFISTRIAGTDGVTLEINKWTTILERNQFNCFYFAGELEKEEEKSFFVAEADFEHPEIKTINEAVFGVTRRLLEISDRIEHLKKHLKLKLYAFTTNFKLDLIVVENALSISMNIPLGLAITEFIAETGIPTIAHHHDFYWEREHYWVNACQDYLDKAFPADFPCIRHVVINSLASRQLSHRVGISNTIVPNVYDFCNPPTATKKGPLELRSKIGLSEEDLFILQPTRVVPRKWIERSIEIVNYLKLPNPILVISHATGHEQGDYFHRIMEYAENMGVKIVTIGEMIDGNRNKGDRYTMGDIYQLADLVTYPSGYEGFGNAFLESIYYRKLIVINRYPIFIADIETKGFDMITFDGFVTQKVISRVRELLDRSDRLKEMVEKNYQLAKEYYSYEVVEKELLDLIGTFE